MNWKLEIYPCSDHLYLRGPWCHSIVKQVHLYECQWCSSPRWVCCPVQVHSLAHGQRTPENHQWTLGAWTLQVRTWGPGSWAQGVYKKNATIEWIMRRALAIYVRIARKGCPCLLHNAVVFVVFFHQQSLIQSSASRKAQKKKKKKVSVKLSYQTEANNR